VRIPGWQLPIDPDEPPPHLRAGLVLLVGLGGIPGALARYGLEQAFTAHPHGLPVATMLVNLTGAFALGLLIPLVHRHSGWRYLLGTGFLGAYTTYSTFAVETDLLARHSHVGVAALYSLGSVALGFVLAGIGPRLVQR
jgi:CrcB protein